MSTKIRLARHGRKGRPFYHVVIADSRAPRDGRYIEKIGTYNPNTNPATIDLKFDRALYWLMTGAQPTDTASRILSYKGVLLKKHLLEGVKKGAFDEAAAEAKFEAWMKEKEAKIQAKIQKLAQAGDAAAKAALEDEAKDRAAKEVFRGLHQRGKPNRRYFERYGSTGCPYGAGEHPHSQGDARKCEPAGKL